MTREVFCAILAALAAGFLVSPLTMPQGQGGVTVYWAGPTL